METPELIQALIKATQQQNTNRVIELTQSALSIEPPHKLYALSQNVIAQTPLHVLAFMAQQTDFFKTISHYHLSYALHSAIHRQNNALFDFLLPQFWHYPKPVSFKEKEWEKEKIKKLFNCFFKAVATHNEHGVLSLLEITRNRSYELVQSRHYAWFEHCYTQQKWETLNFMLTQGFITGSEPRIVKILQKFKHSIPYEQLIQAHAEKDNLQRTTPFFSTLQNPSRPQNKKNKNKI